LPTLESDPLTAALARKGMDGAPGETRARLLARAEGWKAFDVVCTSGPCDRAFEERHAGPSVSIVLGGTFTYRRDRQTFLMTPGALLLGDADRCFTCGHDHGEGDRCISFHFAPDLFERIAAESGARSMTFSACRLAPARTTAPFVVQALDLVRTGGIDEEIVYALAAAALNAAGDTRRPRLATSDVACAAEAAREMARQSDAPHGVANLARRAGLGPYRFLRAFKAATGTTPHQFLLRLRLRNAARLLLETQDAVTEIAYASGFNDLSNFIHAFRSEFGASPREWRKPKHLQAKWSPVRRQKMR
jgi:AraC-like DNA-binding protein